MSKMPLRHDQRNDADLQRDPSPEAAAELKRRSDMATIGSKEPKA